MMRMNSENKLESGLKMKKGLDDKYLGWNFSK